MKIYFDGGSRPNPGPMETAVMVQGRLYHRAGCGTGSSHEAEWLALLHALKIAADLGLGDIKLLGDSKAVVDQANGRQKCRTGSSRNSSKEFVEASRGFRRVRVGHIKRTQNLAGIELVKLRGAPSFDQAAPRSSGQQGMTKDERSVPPGQ